MRITKLQTWLPSRPRRSHRRAATSLPLRVPPTHPNLSTTMDKLLQKSQQRHLAAYPGCLPKRFFAAVPPDQGPNKEATFLANDGCRERERCIYFSPHPTLVGLGRVCLGAAAAPRPLPKGGSTHSKAQKHTPGWAPQGQRQHPRRQLARAVAPPSPFFLPLPNCTPFFPYKRRSLLCNPPFTSTSPLPSCKKQGKPPPSTGSRRRASCSAALSGSFSSCPCP